MTRSKQKGAPHGSSGYTGGRRRKAVASPRGSAAPNQASAVHERGPGSIPPEIVQSPAGPIEAKTEASYPIEAPGAVTPSPATCYPRDRSGGDCVCTTCGKDLPERGLCGDCERDWYGGEIDPASKVVGPSNAATLDEVLRPQEGNGPSSDEHDAHHHEPERVGLPVAHPPFEAPTGEETPAAGGAPAQPEPQETDEHVPHTQQPCMECGSGEHRVVDGLRSAAPEPQGEPVAPKAPTNEPLDRRTFNELCLIGRAADAAAAEVRAVLNAPRTHWCTHCGRDLSPNATWCMYCGREVGSVQEQAAEEPVSPASGSATPSGDAPEGSASALGKIGSYSSTGEKQASPEASAKESALEKRPEPVGVLPCPKCGAEHRACENGCHCTTCGGLHAVAAYTCEQCGGSSARLHRTTRRGSTEDRPWLCDTCWSREVAGPRSEHVYASGVKYRPDTPEAKAQLATFLVRLKGKSDVEERCKECPRLIDCGLRKAGFFCEDPPGAPSEEIMSSTAKPTQRPPINVMPERPLVTALDRMCAWLEHSELTADQSRLCESLLKKLQLCAASVMNAQLRRSWKPRDAS